MWQRIEDVENNLQIDSILLKSIIRIIDILGEGGWTLRINSTKINNGIFVVLSIELQPLKYAFYYYIGVEELNNRGMEVVSHKAVTKNSNCFLIRII